eukprot:g18562.t1
MPPKGRGKGKGKGDPLTPWWGTEFHSNDFCRRFDPMNDFLRERCGVSRVWLERRVGIERAETWWANRQHRLASGWQPPGPRSGPLTGEWLATPWPSSIEELADELGELAPGRGIGRLCSTYGNRAAQPAQPGQHFILDVDGIVDEPEGLSEGLDEEESSSWTSDSEDASHSLYVRRRRWMENGEQKGKGKAAPASGEHQSESWITTAQRQSLFINMSLAAITADEVAAALAASSKDTRDANALLDVLALEDVVKEFSVKLQDHAYGDPNSKDGMKKYMNALRPVCRDYEKKNLIPVRKANDKKGTAGIMIITAGINDDKHTSSSQWKWEKDANHDLIRVVIYRKFILQKMPKLPKIPAGAPASSSSGAAAPAAEAAVDEAAEPEAAAEGEVIELSSSQEQEDEKDLAVGEGSFSGVKDHVWEKRHAAMGAGRNAKRQGKNKKKKHSSLDESDSESDQPAWLRQLYAAKGFPSKHENLN